jgi:O-antigen ligase
LLERKIYYGPREIMRFMGTAFLLLGAFFGVFSRGMVNASFAVLALWALLAFIAFGRGGMVPAPPRPYLAGLAAYFACYLLASLCGHEVVRSLRFMGKIAYLLATGLTVWVALSLTKGFARKLVPYCYGAGLFLWAILSLREQGFCVACLRAKADLGIIESGAVLSQVVPLMVGALALAVGAGAKKRLAFFSLSLAFGALCLYLNCARIALIAAPLLSAMMFLAFRRFFGKAWTLAVCLAVLVLVGAAFLDPAVRGRFQAMFDDKSASNHVRYARWSNGWDVFKAHPLLGVGPDAVPNAPYDSLGTERGPREEHDKYYHAHHVFITVLAEAGVIGFFGFLALHILPLLYVWPYRRSPDPITRFYVWGAVVVFLQLFLNGLTDNVFSLKPLMYVYWTVTSIAMYGAKCGSVNGAERGPAQEAGELSPAGEESGEHPINGETRESPG